MDHENLRVMTPTNPVPRWPEGFVEVLREAAAKEVTIPYCITWVRRFFARFPGRSRCDLGRSEIKTFLSEIAACSGVSNWMGQHVREDLELYYAKFRDISIAPRSAGESAHIFAPCVPAFAAPTGFPAPTIW